MLPTSTGAALSPGVVALSASVVVASSAFAAAICWCGIATSCYYRGMEMVVWLATIANGWERARRVQLAHGTRVLTQLGAGCRSHFMTVRGVNKPITPVGLYYTDITWDRIFSVYALMTAIELHIGVVLKLAMRKGRVHKGHMYAFGGLITRMFHVVRVLEENMDYMAPLFPAPMDITRTKGPNTEFGPILTTVERHRRDELIMARIYGLEMLRHQNGCLASTDIQLGYIERPYPLNAHTKALLVICPEFREPVDGDIPTNEDCLHTSSNVESESTEEVYLTQVKDEV
ncbi:hypothetical protein H5410_050726 [Solanum commersonii]|uniref:Uncharacterized protein n=1 Tax=Solanum commersonii TaxID=4109 RepID=A0A9J5WWB1_SOLCO|nr:hypothetical protein H5410_050726 [Solanum commersonii]